MRNGIAKLAGLVAFAYAIVFFGGIFLHYLQSGSVFTLKYSLGLPSVWLALFVSLVVGYGLIKNYRWAWWLGLFAVLFQLYGAVRNAWLLASTYGALPIGLVLVISLLIIFLALLLTSAARRECLQ